jgi:hypothetical protein
VPYDSHGFTVEDALARSEDVYEVEFRNWGERSAAPAPNVPDRNFQFPAPGQPGLPSSLAAVAIGPRSTVSRCWLSWNRRKPLDVKPADVVDRAAVISTTRELAVGAPLLFAQNGGKGILGPTQSVYEAMQLGLIYAFPFGLPATPPNTAASANQYLQGPLGTTTALPTQYVDQFGVLQPWPVAAEAPFLHLMLYPKLPAFYPPPVRAPMLRSEGFPLGAGNVAKFLWPVYGRRSIRVSAISHAYSTGAARQADYFVGLLRNFNESQWVGADNRAPVFEVTAASALAVAGDTPVNLAVDHPGADYVSITVRNGAIGPGGFAITLVAED